MDRKNAVTLRGNPLTLSGAELKVGDKAPDFSLLDGNLATVKLSDSRGKVRLISVVQSLDTGVCSAQTKTFNEKLASMADKVQAYTVSADLPFAQGRFCSENNITNMQVLSDHRDMAFGNQYGVMIKELRLDARAVFVIDQNDVIKHVQVVPEVTEEPDYARALQVLEEVVK